MIQKIEEIKKDMRNKDKTVKVREIENVFEEFNKKAKTNPSTAAKFSDVYKKIADLKGWPKGLTSDKEIERYIKFVEDLKSLKISAPLEYKFAQDVIEKYIAKVKSNTRVLKDGFINPLVSLAVLPLTCWLLNWIYPRFMDFTFPELSGKKKPKTDSAVKS
jgi:hypothetical protein